VVQRLLGAVDQVGAGCHTLCAEPYVPVCACECACLRVCMCTSKGALLLDSVCADPSIQLIAQALRGEAAAATAGVHKYVAHAGCLDVCVMAHIICDICKC